MGRGTNVKSGIACGSESLSAEVMKHYCIAIEPPLGAESRKERPAKTVASQDMTAGKLLLDYRPQWFHGSAGNNNSETMWRRA
jgi:hypothetical protein